MIDPQRIRDAQSLLARYFGPTRIARAASLSTATRDVFLKIETDLPTGSFKARGALYALAMSLAKGAIGEVVCASTGNHGAAVAWAAQLLGVPATVFLPINPNPVKAARIRELGACLFEAGVDLSAAIGAAEEYAARAPAFFLHDASNPDVPAGAGTIGLELVDQLPELDVVYVPMGDTALIRGVATAAKERCPSIRIVGVVAEQAPAYLLSWMRSHARAGTRAGAGEVVETTTCDTFADGLAIRRPLAPNVAAIRALVDDIVAVTDQEMMAAIGLLERLEHIIAEPAGAAATAALLKRPTTQGTIAVLVTGRNLAPGLVQSVIA